MLDRAFFCWVVRNVRRKIKRSAPTSTSEHPNYLTKPLHIARSSENFGADVVETAAHTLDVPSCYIFLTVYPINHVKFSISHIPLAQISHIAVYTRICAGNFSVFLSLLFALIRFYIRNPSSILCIYYTAIHMHKWTRQRLYFLPPFDFFFNILCFILCLLF